MRSFYKKISDVVPSNKGLKVLSLVLAVICWYGIQSVTNPDKTLTEIAFDGNTNEEWSKKITLPVKLLAPPHRVDFDAKVTPSRVSVEIESKKQGDVANHVGAISAFVDCSGITESGTYKLPAKCISTPSCHVVDISPSHVNLKIEFKDGKVRSTEDENG